MSQVTTSDRFSQVHHPAAQNRGWSTERWVFTGLAVAALGWLLWANVGRDLIRYIKISTM